MWNLLLAAALAPAALAGVGPPQDDLAKLLEQEYQSLIKSDPRPELVRQAAYHISAADRSWDYRRGLAIVRHTRSPAAVPLLLKRMRQLDPNHWRIDEYLLTLGMLTGENTQRLLERHQSVNDLIRDWWVPNRGKINTALDKMTPRQIEQCLFFLLDMVEKDGDRTGQSATNGEPTADRIKQCLSDVAGFEPGIDAPSWKESELSPAMTKPLLRICGVRADGKGVKDNQAICFAAVPLLAALYNNGAAQELSELVDDTQQPLALRWVCLLALARAGEDVAVPRVLGLMQNEKRLEGRLTGLLLLTYLEPSAALEKTLLDALTDSNRNIRTAAVYALQSHPTVSALPNLEKILRDRKETRVHGPVLNIIAQMGSDEAKTALAFTVERMLHEKNNHLSAYDVLSAFQTAVGQRWIEAGAHDDAYYRAKAQDALIWWNAHGRKAAPK